MQTSTGDIDFVVYGCIDLLKLEKSRYADPSVDFALEGTVLNFNLTFAIIWKVMKDILMEKNEYYPLFEKFRIHVEKILWCRGQKPPSCAFHVPSSALGRMRMQQI